MTRLDPVLASLVEAQQTVDQITRALKLPARPFGLPDVSAVRAAIDQRDNEIARLRAELAELRRASAPVEKTYSAGEVATMLRLHRKTVIQWIKDKKLRGKYVARKYLIAGSDLQDFLKATGAPPVKADAATAKMEG